MGRENRRKDEPGNSDIGAHRQSLGVNCFEQALEQPAPVDAAMRPLDHSLGMGHQPKDVARIVENARDAPRRAIDFVEVAEGDAPFSLKSIQGCFAGLVIAVVMSNSTDTFLASI